MPAADILFRETTGLNATIGEIILNRPSALNALTHEMCIAITQQLAVWENTPRIKAVIIRASEGRAFCAGGDVRAIYHLAKQNDLATAQQFFHDEYLMNLAIFHFPKPYVAFLDGITMGGGAGISLHGSHRIATERLVLAMPETAIGFFPDVGASYFLSRCPGKIGTYLGLTGARLNAADALYAGLVDYYLPSDKLDDVVRALTNIEYNHDNYAAVTELLEKLQSPCSDASMLTQYHTQIDHYFAGNTIEEIFSALSSGIELWSQETLQSLQKKSPTSLKVTLQELRTSAHLDFDNCMQLEYGLACHFSHTHDFHEGVRAMLVDKDQTPLWLPANIEAVSEDMVAKFFESSAENQLTI